MNPARIVDLVAEWHYVTPKQILGGSLEQHVVVARFRTAAMLVEFCGYSKASAVRYVGRSWGRTWPERVDQMRAGCGDLIEWIRTTEAGDGRATELTCGPEVSLPVDRTGHPMGENGSSPGDHLGNGSGKSAVVQTEAAYREIITKPPISPSSKPRKRTLPQDWRPSERVRDWLEKQQGWRSINFDRELTSFVDYCDAHGKTYVDFDAAFRNWLSARLPGGRFA